MAVSALRFRGLWEDEMFARQHTWLDLIKIPIDFFLLEMFWSGGRDG